MLRLMDTYLTVPEVAALLRVDPATVRRWINSGRLAAVRLGHGWRVPQTAIDAALERSS